MGQLEDNIKNIFLPNGEKNNSIPIRSDPTTEWEHKNALITNYDVGELDNISEILNKQIPLALFEDALDLHIAVRDVGLVINPLFQMKKTENNPMAKVVVHDLLQFFFIKFQSKILMSRAMKGFERNLQANKSAINKKIGYSLANFRKDKDNQEQGDGDKLYND